MKFKNHRECLTCSDFKFKALKRWCKMHEKEIKKPNNKCDGWSDCMKKNRIMSDGMMGDITDSGIIWHQKGDRNHE